MYTSVDKSNQSIKIGCMDNFEHALHALQNGDVIAYPTEGVFGVGCDPDNVEAILKLLEVKQRPGGKRVNPDSCFLQAAPALCR